MIKNPDINKNTVDVKPEDCKEIVDLTKESLTIQVEAQKRQIQELMDWVGTTMKLLEQAQKEIRELREHVGELYHKGYGEGYQEGVYDGENK